VEGRNCEKALNRGRFELRAAKARELLAEDRSARQAKALEEIAALGDVRGLDRKSYRLVKDRVMRLLRAGR
jgi:hypothetical protein